MMSYMPTLDEILIALQKSFSRVSEKTAEATQKPVGGQPEKARAIIMGDVGFEITLQVVPTCDETEGGKGRPGFDKLCYHPEGNGIMMKLSGAISTDVRPASGDDAKSGSTLRTGGPGNG